MRYKIYLAGPISGQGYEGVVGRYKELIEGLDDYDVLCPMQGKQYLRTELEFKAHGYNQHPASTNHGIIERDHWMVSQADVVLADLTPAGGRVSIGTMMELAWAYHLGKHTIVVMEEGNIHQHAFVLEAADMIFTALDDALSYLHDLAGELK